MCIICGLPNMHKFVNRTEKLLCKKAVNWWFVKYESIGSHSNGDVQLLIYVIVIYQSRIIINQYINNQINNYISIKNNYMSIK